jgi:tetratricopeptide (TPR) repeat protein
MANIRRRQGNLAEAADYARRAVSVDGSEVTAHSAFGYALREQGEHEKAIASFSRALELAPRNAAAHYDLANAHRVIGRLEEAAAGYRRALEIDSKYAAAHNNLGLALQELGDLKGAEAAFRRYINLAPGLGLGYGNLAQLVKFREYNDDIRAMEALLASSSLLPDYRVSVLFGLAKAFDDLEDYERSFQYLHEANRLKRRLLNIDIRVDLEINARMMEILDASFFDIEEETADAVITPILIVGMARSGSTLVEQILASHSRVHGAGELTDLQQMFSPWMERIRSGTFPRRASALPREELRQLGARYLQVLRMHSPSAPYITDKMPFNYRFLGFLRLILPHAKIIHCLRDPVDTCVSCYKRLFSSGVFFSHDLVELGPIITPISSLWSIGGRFCRARCLKSSMKS